MFSEMTKVLASIRCSHSLSFRMPNEIKEEGSESLA